MTNKSSYRTAETIETQRAQKKEEDARNANSELPPGGVGSQLAAVPTQHIAQQFSIHQCANASDEGYKKEDRGKSATYPSNPAAQRNEDHVNLESRRQRHILNNLTQSFDENAAADDIKREATKFEEINFPISNRVKANEYLMPL